MEATIVIADDNVFIVELLSDLLRAGRIPRLAGL
jgi:hypothetical protein